VKNKLKVLVAESNYDFRYLYQSYLDSLCLKLEMMDSGEACLNRLFKDKNANNSNFDIVVINTHLFDKSGLDIAKEIHKKSPNQRLLLSLLSPWNIYLKSNWTLQVLTVNVY
jgi:CheY-like chemotaxis protein